MEIIISIMLVVLSLGIYKVSKLIVKKPKEFIGHNKSKITSVDYTSHGKKVLVKFENEQGQIIQGNSRVFNSTKEFHLGDEIEYDYYYLDDGINDSFYSYDRTAMIRICDPSVKGYGLYENKTISQILKIVSLCLFVLAIYVLSKIFL